MRVRFHHYGYHDGYHSRPSARGRSRDLLTCVQARRTPGGTVAFVEADMSRPGDVCDVIIAEDGRTLLADGVRPQASGNPVRGTAGMDGAVAGAVDDQGRPLGQGLGVPRSSRGTDRAPGVRAAALIARIPEPAIWAQWGSAMSVQRGDPSVRSRNDPSDQGV